MSNKWDKNQFRIVFTLYKYYCKNLFTTLQLLKYSTIEMVGWWRSILTTTPKRHSKFIKNEWLLESSAYADARSSYEVPNGWASCADLMSASVERRESVVRWNDGLPRRGRRNMDDSWYFQLHVTALQPVVFAFELLSVPFYTSLYPGRLWGWMRICNDQRS